MDVKEMTFEEFIAFGEKKTGQKVDSEVKAILQIMFDNLKSEVWSKDDLRRMTDTLKATLKQRKNERKYI